MNNHYQIPHPFPVFNVKRSEVWNLSRAALHQAADPDGQTNYSHAMSLLTNAAGFIAEIAMVNAESVDDLDLVGNCIDLNKIDFNRLLEELGDAVEKKRVMLVD